MYERLTEFAWFVLELLGAGTAAAVVGFLIYHLSEKFARSRRD